MSANPPHPRRANRHLRVPVLAIGLAVALAGCGGDGDDGQSAETQPSPQAAGGKVRVTLDDFSIAPKALVVERGSTITAENTGAVVHNFTVEKGPDANEDTEDLAASTTFGPGESDDLKLDLKPGRYVTVCTVADHRQLGMTGTLTVE